MICRGRHCTRLDVLIEEVAFNNVAELHVDPRITRGVFPITDEL